MQIISNRDLDKLIDILKLFIDKKSNDYEASAPIAIIFTYHIIDDLNASKVKTKFILPNDKIKVTKNAYKFYGYNLPLTSDIYKWGKIISKHSNNFTINKKGSYFQYEITKFKTYQIVKVMKLDKVLLEFKDIFGTNFSNFNRIFIPNNDIYIIENGNINFKEIIKTTGYIEPTKIAKTLINKYITLDIETRTINNQVIPYCISLFDGTTAWSYYLTDFNNSDLMLQAAIKSICKDRYNNYLVYAHNLSNFDGIFLLKNMVNVGSLEPIIRDSKMIQLILNFPLKNNKNGKIIFRDSLLLLPGSLRKLAQSFNVVNKSWFPYDFVNNINIPLNYEGVKPDISLWNQISVEEYNLIPNNWNLKNETIKYCEQDCITLYNILVKFNFLIFDKFNVNINRYPTLPSLAFGIFRTNFLDKDIIPKFSGQMFNDIKESFTGGHTDMYIPFGEKLKHYDVNSLYPFVMYDKDMPVAPIKYFEGDILTKVKDPFGFFYCEIITPENMDRPVLQTKVKTIDGFRTVAPLGTWKDWLFSEELFKYIEYGYTFRIIKGYTFGRTNLFRSYVQTLYLIKQNTPKSDPMYLISKLLMNSLFGVWIQNYLAM